ncbi:MULTISPECIES: type VI secretion system protein TssA [unclassified Pseudomonas]|uniref:type VI secretion system protein TssA n=1 Tax=unclassified Pseudomonas TaxID=196821 RepID=UPI0035C1B8F7
MSLVTPVSAEEIARLLAPIDPQSPAGLFDIEDETYQAVDQEMVKLGGLQESSIDWLYIEEASRHYLTRQCKQLRIVGHLSVAWLRGGSWENWGFTLALLAGMVERYWETAYPTPGAKGYPGKRKLIERVLKRLLDTLPRLDRFSYTADRDAVAQQALSCLQQQVALAKLDAALVAELEHLLLKQSKEAMGAVQAQASATASPKVVAAPLAEAFTPSVSGVSLGNERETRRAVLGMAEFLNQQDLYDPTGYQLRRFGMWAHITSAPAAGQAHRTELMAVPADIATGYEEAIASRAIDPVLLQRVEKSVTASPYWIRGSFLAANMATHLAMGEVAEGIRAATSRFVRRLPALQQLCFSDGTAFVDEQCLAWLRGHDGQPTEAAQAQEFSSLHDALANQLDAEGIEPVLLTLQGLYAECRSPRERCHTTLIAADLLATRGVSWLARDLCSSVAQTMRHTAADAWEPETFQRLGQHGAAAIQIEPDKD